jgi:hypothetical protein
MSRPKITIHNAATGETVEREMNDEEFAQYELDQIAAQEQKAAEEAAAQEAATKKAALLDKLGITEEEAKLLLS